MIPIKKQMTVMNRLATGLGQDVLDLRAGKLDEKKATVISRLSGKAIKAVVEGVVLANHQEIQKQKIEVSRKNAESKIENNKR